ncbi:hypothetical protein [Paenibacillus sp. Soil750]|nr:hypothetical protein [Paenibacillus sp. Soil750]
MSGTVSGTAACERTVNGHRRRYLLEFDAPDSLTDTAYAMEWKSG